MNSKKRCDCCKDNENNERKKIANAAPRVIKEKENIVQEKRSCGCARTISSETKPAAISCKPRRNSIITQCSVDRNQTKATVSAIDNKTKVASRPPLAELKAKSGNVQSSSVVKNCSGAVKKVTDPKPANNLINKRKAAPLAVSTVKRHPGRASTGVINSTQINATCSKLPITKTQSTVLTSTQRKTIICPKPSISKTQSTINITGKSTKRSLPSSTLISSTAPAKPRKCYCTQKPSTTISTVKLPTIQKSLIPIVEQKPLNIPEKQVLEKTVNISRGFDCGSPILNTSFHTPSGNTDEWLTFKTNKTEQSSQLPFKEIKTVKTFGIDECGFDLDNVPAQIVFDGIPSLRKKTLKKQLSVSSGYKGVINLDPYTNKVHPAVLYSDYMIDVINNIIEKEEKLKIDKDLMKRSKMISIYRTAIINWLIKLHQFVNSDSNVFFLCVRLFDKLLTKIEISQELLQLTAMITYWIANKYGDSVEYLTIRKLQELSCNRYSAKYIMGYERKILNILNYDISIEDPIIFVRYYIYILQVEDSNDMSFCANYLLDCLATSWDINTFPLSLQASGAVFLSLQFLENKLSDWDKIEFYPGYYTADDLYIVNERILERLLLIQNEGYEFREIYQKYACEKYNYISLKVCEGIKNLK